MKYIPLHMYVSGKLSQIVPLYGEMQLRSQIYIGNCSRGHRLGMPESVREDRIQREMLGSSTFILLDPFRSCLVMVRGRFRKRK